MGGCGDFYDVGIYMGSRYCPVWNYNMDKLEKFRVNFSSWSVLSII